MLQRLLAVMVVLGVRVLCVILVAGGAGARVPECANMNVASEVNHLLLLASKKREVALLLQSMLLVHPWCRLLRDLHKERLIAPVILGYLWNYFSFCHRAIQL